jgi:SpoIID/LytB domain protein
MLHTRALPLRRIATLIVVAVAAATAGASAPRVDASLSSVTFDGGGYGHGIGLSQWGAYGYAVDDGWSATQILDRYYAGTVAATVSAQDVTVRMLLHDDRQTAAVHDGGALLVDGFSPEGPWRSVVVREMGGVYRVFARADAMVCPAEGSAVDGSTGWTQLTGSAATVTIRTSTDATASAAYGDLISLCEPNGRVRSYRGIIRAVNGTEGENRTVNQVPLEHYLRSVVASEMPASWGTAGGGRGAQALQAQAVAARSYALAENRYSYARTCDLQFCQTYLGAAWRTGLGAAFTPIEKSTTDAAVTATAGIVRRVGSASGPIAYAMYSSSSGGQTAPSTLNFGSVADDGDDTTANPYHRWSTTVSAATIQAAYPAVGTLTGVAVVARDGQGPWGGRATSVRIDGSSGSVTVTGNSFRSALGLRSTLFTTGGSTPPPPPSPAPPPPSANGCGTRVAPEIVEPAGSQPPARFTPVPPVRLVDTREGFGAPLGVVPAGCTLAIDTGAPAGASAVMVNVTAVDTLFNGFITAYPCGQPRPNASATQAVRGGIVAGGAIVPLGRDGRLCVFAHPTTHLVVDLFGYYSPASGERFQPIDTVRRLDTRSGAALAGGSVTRVRVAGVSGIPTGARAVALTVQAVSARGPGFISVYPCAPTRPTVSNVNVPQGGTIANHVQVGVTTTGEICVYVHATMHVIVDVSGWYGPGATTDFVAVSPTRVIDTRIGVGLAGAFATGANRAIPLAGTSGLPAGGALRAIAAVVTTTESTGTGFITVHPCRTPPPKVSMVRYTPWSNMATTVVGNVDSAGRWCLYASAATHLVMDVNGYFTN